MVEVEKKIVTPERVALSFSIPFLWIPVIIVVKKLEGKKYQNDLDMHDFQL